MGVIRKISLVPFWTTFVLILATVFLYPVHAEPDKKGVLIMVCSCGKPAFAVLATPDGVHVEGLLDSPKLVSACRSKDKQIGDLIILRAESYTKEVCPLSI